MFYFSKLIMSIRDEMQNPKVPYTVSCSEGLETVYSAAAVVYKNREQIT